MTLVTLWYSMAPDRQDAFLDGCVAAPMERDGLVRNKGIQVTGSIAAALLRPLKCNNSASRASFPRERLTVPLSSVDSRYSWAPGKSVTLHDKSHSRDLLRRKNPRGWPPLE